MGGKAGDRDHAYHHPPASAGLHRSSADGYDPACPRLPLLLALHGGDGDHGFLKNRQPYIEQMWSAGRLPKMVIATPDADRFFYMDRKDGSQKWETAILFELVDHLRDQYKVSRERSGLFVYGISMGGMGGLRMDSSIPSAWAR